MKWLVRGLAAVIAIPFVLLAVVLLGANTDPGRHLIETLTPRLTAGMIRIEGIAGRFPDAVRLRRLTIADAGGVWLTVADAGLDWSPLRLISGEVSIGRLEAGRVAVERQPASSGSSGGMSLPPLRIALSDLEIQRLEIGAAVAGQPVSLMVAGSGELAAKDIGTVHLAITTSGAGTGDHYIADVSMDQSRFHATLSVAEAPNGLIAGLAGLPDLGKIAITASADGPLNALAVKASIEAGQLLGQVDGTLDPTSQGTDLSFQVKAPAMTPGQGIGWSSIQLDGAVHGSLAAPETKGTLAIDGATAAGAAIGTLRADISGNASGETELHARLDGLRLPGEVPDLLAGGTMVLDATAQTRDPRIPVRFSLRHPLFTANGTADMTHGQVRLTLPDLTPFTAAGGLDFGGKTDLNVAAERSNGTISLTVAGTVAPSVSTGAAGAAHSLAVLIGQAGTIDFAAAVHGEDVRLSRLALSGGGFRASASGQYVNHQLNLDSAIALTQLGALRPGTSGAVEASVHVAGPATSLSVTGDVKGDVAGEFGRLDRFTLHLDASGLPDTPQGRLTAGGTVLGAPLDVAVAAERRNGGFHIVIDHLAWKSLTGGGTLDLAAGEALPEGQIRLSMTRLADLAPVVGRPVAGQITASLESSPTLTRINAVVTGAAIPATGSVSKVVLDATITDPAGEPAVDGALVLNGIDASGIRASARLSAKGKLDSLALTFGAESGDARGAPGRLETSGTVNATAGTLSLASLQGVWGKETIRLLAPATISFHQPLTVDRLRLGFRQGELMVAGKWDARPGGGGLDLRASLLDLPADLAADFVPSYAADGKISAEARLTGDPAHPKGTIRLTALGLRERTGPGRAMPPATTTVNATLDGSNAVVDAKLTAGPSSVILTGRAPLDFARPMDLRVAGNVDLAMLNPLLTAQGRAVKGRLDLALAVAGAPATPKVAGTVRLSGADVQDATLGAHIAAISAAAQMDGDRVRLDRFVGTAGQGTISASGTVAWGAVPTVDMSVRASDARILNSDLVTAPIDANLTLRGPITGTPTLAGTVLVRSAEIRVPEKLPPSVAVLPVRDPREPPKKPPPPAATPDIALDLTLDAPSQVYIRGRGLDAELGGRIVFRGTASHPLPEGGLHLRRGAFSLAGVSLNLTEGTVDFAGGALTNPPLKLVATSTTATFTATLTVSGEVRNPKIVLSSVPDLPQDEILSQLLFHTATARLSPFQIAQIAAALASISGVGPSGGDPLGRVRSALGLDQLSVGSGPGGGATLQAGRYLAPGVRVGATKGTGGETQATVQIDIAKGLKLETTAGIGSAPATPTPGTSNGTGVGVTYQFEY